MIAGRAEIAAEEAAPEKRTFTDFFREILAGEEPLEWNESIGGGSKFTLCECLMAVLDEQVHGNMTASNIDFVLSLVRALSPQSSALPATRQDYDRMIRTLENNTYFFLTCSLHCQPCKRTDTNCPMCNEPLRVNGKPAGFFYVRDPRVWVSRLRALPSISAALKYPIERKNTKKGDAILEDVWDGEFFKWLMKPNAPPLFTPRKDPLPIKFGTSGLRIISNQTL